MLKNNATVLEMTNEVIVAFISKNEPNPETVNGLIRSVHAILTELADQDAKRAAVVTQLPALPLDKTVSPDFVFCLERGKRFRTLRFHLNTHGLEPNGYIAKWGLPGNHPLVAPNLSSRKSFLAEASGLGQSRHPRRNGAMKATSFRPFPSRRP